MIIIEIKYHIYNAKKTILIKSLEMMVTLLIRYINNKRKAQLFNILDMLINAAKQE